MRAMRFVFTALAMCAAAGFALADAPKVAVSTPRALRVAIVDGGPKVAWREASNLAWAEVFYAAIAPETVGAWPVRSESLDARTAAAHLDAGICDAVMVVGATRPRNFRRTESPMLAAHLGADRNYEPAYLIIADGDPRLRQLLAEGFLRAMSGPLMARGRVVASR